MQPQSLSRILRPLVLPSAFCAIMLSSICLATPQGLVEQKFTEAQKADLAESRELNRKSFQLFDKGEVAQATELVLRVLAIRMKVLGSDHPEVAASLNNLAALYDAQGNTDGARSLYERALGTSEAALGPEHADVAICLTNLANFHASKGDASAAIPLFQRALKIRNTALGSDDPDTIKILVELGALHKRQGNFTEALEYYEQSLSILVKTVGTDHPDTALMFNRLATVYDDQGAYTTAESLYKRALAVMEKTRGPDHPETATCLNNLAYVFRQQGQDAAALPLYQRALQINQKALGTDHPRTALSLNNLASLYEAQGNSADAIPMLQRALEIREKSLGPEHSETAQSLNNLAMSYQRQHNYATAKSLGERALAIREKTLGANHPLTAASLNNLAGINQAMGDFAAALTYFERALSVFEATLGSDHSSTAQAVHNLALLHEKQGNYTAAESLNSRAISILDKAVGPAHPITTTVLKNSAMLQAKLGQLTDSIELFDRSRRGVRLYASEVLPVLSEREQTLFLNANYLSGFHAALSLAIQNSGNVGLVRLSGAWLANGKAVAEEALAERNLIARDELNSQHDAVFQKMRHIRTQLASLAMTATDGNAGTAKQKLVNKLTLELQNLEQQLATSGDGRTNKVAYWTDMKQIRSHLSHDEVFVDIARVNSYDFSADADQKRTTDYGRWRPPRYVAWLTHGSRRTDDGSTILIDLGPADEIDAAIEKVRQSINSSFGNTGTINVDGEEAATASTYRELQALAASIWKPLELHLRDATKVILSPDGSLWLVPWACLPVGNEGPRYLIEQFQLRFVTSGRALIVNNEKRETGPPVILANPSYDPATDNHQDPQELATAEANINSKSGRLPFAGRARLPRVGPLPNTLVEALMIRPKLEKYTGRKVKLYEGHNALESVAKSLNRPIVVTFATHGFFLPQRTFSLEDQNRKALGEQHGDAASVESRSIENPLLRCGLMLSGCNHRDSVFDDDDGILTGMEIVGIDFRGTELVVLSACETGIGDVRNGEGVAGLRQAFQLAGAEAVVSTLWQIPDRESALLMRTFFKGLAASKSKVQALRDAQLERIEERRRRYGAAHPFFWAAFTLTGK